VADAELAPERPVLPSANIQRTRSQFFSNRGFGSIDTLPVGHRSGE